MFINFSNHSSSRWSEGQLSAATAYGDIKDIQFPNVSPTATSADISILAYKLTEEIIEQKPTVVMCQGEFSLTYAVTTRLLSAGIKVVVACSDRKVIEVQNPNGSTTKNTVFEFIGFREVI